MVQFILSQEIWTLTKVEFFEGKFLTFFSTCDSGNTQNFGVSWLYSSSVARKIRKKVVHVFSSRFWKQNKIYSYSFPFCLGDDSGAYAGWLAERLFSFIVNATIALSILSFFLCTFLGLGRANKWRIALPYSIFREWKSLWARRVCLNTNSIFETRQI